MNRQDSRYEVPHQADAEPSGLWLSAVMAIKDARRSLVGASFIIAQPLLLNALSIPVTAYIIATLGPVNYGEWSVALTLISTLTVLTNLGLRSFFVRAVAWHPDTAADLFAEQLGCRVILGVCAGTIAVSAAYLLNYPKVVWQCTAVLAFGLVLTAAAAVVSDLLTAMELLPALATINFIAGLVLTTASAVVMWMNWGPVSLASAYLLGPIITGSLSLLFVHRRMFRVRICWDPARLWNLLKQARVLGLQLFVAEFGNQAENLLVPKWVGMSSFGFFAAGTLLPRRLDILADGLNTAFYPVLAKSYRESRHSATRTVRWLALFMIAACLPPAILLFALAHPIAKVLFPHDPALCATIIEITCWCIPLSGVGHAMGYALNAAGRERDEATLTIAGTIFSLIVSAVLIWKFGLIGACAALVSKSAIGIVFRLRRFIETLRSTGVSMPPPVAVEPIS
jgi:PST family polysaccharide transporter